MSAHDDKGGEDVRSGHSAAWIRDAARRVWSLHLRRTSRRLHKKALRIYERGWKCGALADEHDRKLADRV